MMLDTERPNLKLFLMPLSPHHKLIISLSPVQDIFSHDNILIYFVISIKQNFLKIITRKKNTFIFNFAPSENVFLLILLPYP